MMAMEPAWQTPDYMNRATQIADPIFLAIFTVEMVLKIVARGFYGENIIHHICQLDVGVRQNA